MSFIATRKQPSIKFAMIFLILFGLVFGGIGVGFGVYTWREVKASSRATGTVVRLIPHQGRHGLTYQRVVQFTIPTGETYTGQEKNSSNPTSDVGDKVEVYYRNDRPESIIVNSFTDVYLFPLVFGGIGMLVIVIGIVIMSRFIHNKKLLARLKSEGLPVTATVKKIDVDTHYRMNGSLPYVIYAEGKDPITSETRTFKSERLWIPNIPDKVKDTVQVFVDRTDSAQYVFDIEG